MSLGTRRFEARTRIRDRRPTKKTFAATSTLPTRLATILVSVAMAFLVTVAMTLLVAAAMVLLAVVVNVVGPCGKRWM